MSDFCDLCQTSHKESLACVLLGCARLEAQGFDKTLIDPTDYVVRAGCSQCEAAVINGVAAHEHGCPNAKRVYSVAGVIDNDDEEALG